MLKKSQNGLLLKSINFFVKYLNRHIFTIFNTKDIQVFVKSQIENFISLTIVRSFFRIWKSTLGQCIIKLGKNSFKQHQKMYGITTCHPCKRKAFTLKCARSCVRETQLVKLYLNWKVRSRQTHFKVLNGRFVHSDFIIYWQIS